MSDPASTFFQTRVIQAAAASGFVRTFSCCGVEDKLCTTDQWGGNLEAFASEFLKLEKENNERRNPST